MTTIDITQKLEYVASSLAQSRECACCKSSRMDEEIYLLRCAVAMLHDILKSQHDADVMRAEAKAAWEAENRPKSKVMVPAMDMSKLRG